MNKISWFDRWFLNKLMQARNNEHLIRRNNVPETISVQESDPHSLTDGITIHLKTVIGGKLVTFNWYDEHRDERKRRTYIVTDEQDFNSELAKIITMESMR